MKLFLAPSVRKWVAYTGLATLAASSMPVFADQEFAEVLSATPITREVRVSTPTQQCYDQQVSSGNQGSGLVGTLIGGLAGGLLGHTVGGGSGKAIATAAGAVGGAVVGNNIAQNNSGGGPAYQQRCQTVYNDQYESRAEGYDVTYRYHGEIYHTRMPYDPGSQIPVNVQVTPAGGY